MVDNPSNPETTMATSECKCYVPGGEHRYVDGICVLCDAEMRPTAQEQEIGKLFRENEQMRGFLERAMAHGLNGNRYYHALEASDLGDEIKRFLEDSP